MECCKNRFCKQFLQRCQDNYLQSFSHSGLSRIGEYLNLKKDADKYQLRPYLEKIRIVEDSSTTMSRLRTGCPYLTADTGRFNDTPRSDRKCLLCNNGL